MEDESWWFFDRRVIVKAFGGQLRNSTGIDAFSRIESRARPWDTLMYRIPNGFAQSMIHDQRTMSAVNSWNSLIFCQATHRSHTPHQK